MAPQMERFLSEGVPRSVPPGGERGKALADVKTVHGQVLEFQHSAISEEERSSREAIYEPMCCGERPAVEGR